MTQQWDEEYDVVVVGSGGGALTAAYLAARAGLSTVVVEKTARLGGLSSYSGAAVWLAGTQVQEREGIRDSTESARTYLRAVLGPGDAEKQEAFVTEAPGLVAQLEEDPAIRFTHEVFPDYYDRPGRVPGGRSIIPVDIEQRELGHLVSLVRPPVTNDRKGEDHPEGPLSRGRALIARLLLAYYRTGHGTIRTETCMDELVTDDGRVVGIAATRGGRRTRIRGRKGVVLAGGGFENSDDLRREYNVPGKAEWSLAPTGSNVGEPMRAAMAIGADTDLMYEGWMCPGVATPDGRAGFAFYLTGGLIVDGSGARYANEFLPYDQLGRQMANDPSRVPSYLIFDDRDGGDLPAFAMPAADRGDHFAAGTWVKAETLPELAEFIGVPAETLTATVERFNGFADGGKDEDFGRGEDEFGTFCSDPALVRVDKAPYYAAKLVLSDVGTKGGLVTDVAGRVLTGDGVPIAGLYAVGDTSASFTGAFYPGPGTPIGTAMVFGSLAAKDIIG